MTVCTATIPVGDETIQCENGAPCTDHEAFWPTGPRDDVDYEPKLAIQWDDTAPGAEPHEPHHHWAYENYKGQWFVIRGDGTQGNDHLAVFEPFHPDPEGAARNEAARLNLDRPDIVIHVAEVATERDEAQADRDRYRRALDRIATFGTKNPAAFARCVLEGADADNGV